MADTKISALTAATTPLAGTEVLPIVQGGVTKKVTIADLTAGRAVNVASLTASGNVQVDTLNFGSSYGQLTWDTGVAIIQAYSGKDVVIRTNGSSTNVLRVGAADVTFGVGNLVFSTSGKGIVSSNITQYYADASGVTTTNTNEVSVLNRNTAADGVIIRYQKQGSTVGYISTNTYSLPSDERVKKNIVPISLGLEFILDLEPVEYNTIFQDPENQSHKNFGLKAQQVEVALQKHGKTVNDVTFLEKFEKYKEGESQYGIGYQNLVPVLIRATHQLQAQIDELKGARNVAN